MLWTLIRHAYSGQSESAGVAAHKNLLELVTDIIQLGKKLLRACGWNFTNCEDFMILWTKKACKRKGFPVLEPLFEGLKRLDSCDVPIILCNMEQDIDHCSSWDLLPCDDLKSLCCAAFKHEHPIKYFLSYFWCKPASDRFANLCFFSSYMMGR